ncbi:MAG: hypothetical protein ABIQ99_17655, partial [Thermoflexales bacterium]
QSKLSDYGMNFKVKGGHETTFEFDVAALRGYRLYAFSCTVDAKDKPTKMKLFEAYQRARQLGGEEARVALVCYSEDPNGLLDDVTSSNFFVEDSVRVFGKRDIQAGLANAFQDWITKL